MSESPWAVISVDMDTAADHLQGYGHTGEDAGRDDPVYQRALPRVLQLFEQRGIRATFFVIGRDASVHADRLREIVARGHEVACHSFAHRQPFSARPRDQIRAELFRARRELEDAASDRVIGFRAPGFDVRPGVLEAAADAGFLYDASVFPGPFLPVLRFTTWWLGSKSRDIFKMAVWRHCFSRRSFHQRTLGTGRRMAEFPTTLAPFLQVPLYHTMSHYLGERLLRRLLSWTSRVGRDLSYLLHGVDFLDLEEDRVDRRLSSHPGMAVPETCRRRKLESILTTIKNRFHLASFREIVERQHDGRAGSPGEAQRFDVGALPVSGS